MLKNNLFILLILLCNLAISQIGGYAPNYINNTTNYITATDEIKYFLNTDVSNNTINRVDIMGLTMNLEVGWYRVEFVPFYNVNATTTGIGFDFASGTATLTNYSFRSILPSTSTANYNNNYVARNQNFTVAQTSRINDNRGTIIVEFQCTVAGTLIPRFRSETTGLVTLKTGTYIVVKKIL